MLHSVNQVDESNKLEQYMLIMCGLDASLRLCHPMKRQNQLTLIQLLACLPAAAFSIQIKKYIIYLSDNGKHFSKFWKM